MMQLFIEDIHQFHLCLPKLHQSAFAARATGRAYSASRRQPLSMVSAGQFEARGRKEEKRGLPPANDGG